MMVINRILMGGGLLVALFLPLIFNPYAALPFEPVKVLFFRGVVAGMGASLLLLGARKGSRQAFMRTLGHDNPLLLPVLLYGLCYLLATFFSVKPEDSFWGLSDKHGTLTTLCGVLFFLLIAATLRRGKQLEQLITALLLGTVPVCFYGLLQFLALDPLHWVTDSVSPILSTMGRSNYLGAYLAIVIPFTLYKLAILRPLSKKGQAGVALVLLLQVICLLLTQARAAWLAFVGSLSLFMLLAAHRRPLRQKVLLLAGFWLISACLFMGLNQVFSSPHTQTAAPAPSSEAFFAQQRTESINRRFIIWRSTLQLIPQRWLLGYGAETFVTIFSSHYPPGSLYDGRDALVDDPHNLLLEQLFAVGLLGLSAFIMLCARLYTVLLNTFYDTPNKRHQLLVAAHLSAVSAFLIQAQFNPDVIVLTTLFWLILAMSVTVKRLRRNPKLALARSPKLALVEWS